MEDPNTLVYLAAVVSAVTAVATIVVLPMLAYIVRRNDQADDRRDSRLEALEKKSASQDVSQTELRGKVEMIGLLFGELREMRGQMLTKDEFERRMALLEREMRARDSDGD